MPQIRFNSSNIKKIKYGRRYGWYYYNNGLLEGEHIMTRDKLISEINAILVLIRGFNRPAEAINRLEELLKTLKGKESNK